MRIIGIDPGTHTGVAVWDCTAQRFDALESLPVHRALPYVAGLIAVENPPPVIFEDARKRTWFGHSGREVLQGAGAAKRDATIWEQFLEDYGTPYLARSPRAGSTKWSAERFRNVTKWATRTNEHARDAGVLVFGFRDHEVTNVWRSWDQLRANKTPTASARR